MVKRKGTPHDAAASNLRGQKTQSAQAFRQILKVIARNMVSPAGILGCSIVLWLATLSIGTAMLMTSRTDAFNHALRNSRNLTLVLERDIERSIDLYDLSLRAVSDGAANSQVMALPANLRDRVLFDRAATAHYMGPMTISAGNGTLIATSDPRSAGRERAAPDLNAAGHLMTPDGLYIGRPVHSSANPAQFAIPLGRSIYRPDGKFLGTVMGSLSMEYFRELTNGLSIGERGSVIVFETDGTLISRLPDSSENIGRNFAQSPIFRRLMTGTEGHFVGTPNLDGVRRLYVYKRLPDLPLIVAVAPAMSTVYAEWWARATWFGALILAFTAIKAAGTWLFVRELRRRQRAEASLERMAHHDPLTGLENRATFDDVLAREWKCARRNEKPLSLLFIDIDRFKSYNDQYGHQAGDVALKSVATRIAACLDRPGDHAARYGGEEFIVVLPDTDTRGAALMAEKIRSAVFNLQIEHRQAPLQMLTVSIGVSTTAVDRVTDASTLLKTADMALYEAKRLGRNCVSIVPQLDTECAA
nr:diguanylate cyclase [Paraburkholderia bannensis]